MRSVKGRDLACCITDGLFSVSVGGLMLLWSCCADHRCHVGSSGDAVFPALKSGLVTLDNISLSFKPGLLVTLDNILLCFFGKHNILKCVKMNNIDL